MPLWRLSNDKDENRTKAGQGLEQHEEDDEQNTVKPNQPVHFRGDQIKDADAT